MSSQSIPLFPLPLVLFPGGPLPLRIFETRYVDMVSRCTREELAFGVALLVSSGDEGVARLVEIGTSARIVDWNQGEDGLLYITGRGEQRFRIASMGQQEDGLHTAEVEWFDDLESAAPAELLDPMALVLRALLEANAALYEEETRQYDDAGWVGFRLAEILPLDLQTRQRCLEMRSAKARLELLQPVVSQVSRKHKHTPE